MTSDSEKWKTMAIENKYRVITPTQGMVVQLSSDDWRIFDNGEWREMTVTEQIEASK